jgi:serine/threonine protein kinase/tetratricopeptide (TPR) repeat protein
MSKDSSLNSVFCAALEIASPDERVAYLDRACAHDPQLRSRVQQLLDAHFQAGSFMEAPATDLLSPEGLGAERSSSLAEGPGSRIGPYKLLQQIGEGGMGVVYMAEQEHHVRRKVALKIIKPGMDSAQVIARFEAERQALAMMDHVNIARVLDAGTTHRRPLAPREGAPLAEREVYDGRPYFVMELVHGVPITRYCDDSHLTPRERLELFVPVCQAIQHAHQKGIIHRDVKPSNVLVTLHDGKPVPKVIDFGVAKAIDQRLTERTLFTQFGAIVGTFEYMSPEQAEMSGLGVETRSDIYSLGVLLYELLTGTTPLSRKRLKDTALPEVLRLIREEEAQRPSTRLRSSDMLPAIAAARKTEPARLSRLVRGELDWIVMKALEKDRTRRYESASGLARDIERYLADEPVEACPPSAMYKLRKFARKHKKVLATSAAFVLLLVTGIITSTWQAVRATEAEAHANSQKAAAEEDRDRAQDAQHRAQDAQHRAQDAQHEAEKQRRIAQGERDRALEEKKRADAETEIAQGVKEFLYRDVLGQANPFNQIGPHARLGRDLRMQDALDEAARGIKGKFANRPQIEVAVRTIIGDAYRVMGQLAKAKEQLETALAMSTKNVGPEHPNTLAVQSNLGNLYASQGQYAKAKELLERTLATEQRVLGPEHRDALATMLNLAGVHFETQQYAKAEELFREVVRCYVRDLGEKDPVTLVARQNLAEAYTAQGQHAKAEALTLKVLEARRQVLGPDHPDTLQSLGSLAILHLYKSEFARAESLSKEVERASSRVLGPEHPLTLLAMMHVAAAQKGQGDFAGAEAGYLKVLERSKRALGPDHYLTGAILHNLAELYGQQKEYGKARPLVEQALESQLRVLGEEHLETLTTMNQLGVIYYVQRMDDKAELLFRKAWEGMSRALGDDHPDVLMTAQNLIALYQRQRQLDRVIPLLEKVLESQQRSLGEKHADTLATTYSLADMFRQLGQFAKAEPLYEKALERMAPDDPRTLVAMNNLAVVYSAQKKYARAEPLLKKALAGHQRRLGPEHPTTLMFLGNLATFYGDWKKYPEEGKYRHQLLEAQRKRLPADDPNLAATLALLGQCLLNQEKFAAAEPILGECRKIYDQRLPESWMRFWATSMLGASLAGQKKYAEAEPLLLQGYKGMKDREQTIRMPWRTIRLTQAVERLVQLYDAWDKKDQADEWRKKLPSAKSEMP